LSPIPRLFVLSHSQKYELGYIHELQLTDTLVPGVTGNILSTIPLDNTTLTNTGKDFTGITFNLEGNLVVLGRRLTDDIPPIEQAVLYTINLNGQRVGGPISIPQPPIITPTDLAFDHTYKNYWVVDRDTNAIYEMVLTCCEEKNDGYLKRWEQQLRMKRVWGCEFGLQGYQNVFIKRQADVTTEVPLTTANSPNVLRYVSMPAFADPEGVDVDPVTGHVWVLNDAPTTVLYELTTDGTVVNYWQLEQLTGLQDANSVAVTESWVIVGFDDERTIVVFDKDDDDADLPI